MAALPYMQFYVADYLADTMHLSTEEHGAYLLIIFNYWQTGKPIPKARLPKIARLNNERWTSVEQALSEFFKDDGEQWIHERIECDLTSVKVTQDQRIAAGKASAEARKQAKKAEISMVINDRSTDVQHPLNEIEEIRGEENNLEAPVGDESPQLILVSDESRTDFIPYGRILQAYRENLPMLPQPKKLEEDRRKAVKRIWTKEESYGSVEFFARYFAYVAKSPFLTGETGWSGCGFDWLMKPANFRKITEGNYHGENQ